MDGGSLQSALYHSELAEPRQATPKHCGSLHVI